jgi:hypothetical protein
MSQENTAHVPSEGNLSTLQDALCNLYEHINSARAVLASVQVALPALLHGMSEQQRNGICQAGELAVACDNLFELCERDFEFIEKHLDASTI